MAKFIGATKTQKAIASLLAKRAKPSAAVSLVPKIDRMLPLRSPQAQRSYSKNRISQIKPIGIY